MSAVNPEIIRFMSPPGKFLRGTAASLGGAFIGEDIRFGAGVSTRQCGEFLGER
jgi:hypothetical protein